MSRPIVAVVGRPNVGKSTLFNRLAGERISIVQDTPGVTRDRIYADVEWLDRKFTLIDTGGMEIGSEEVIQKQIVQQAQIAIETADVILFVTDVKTGVTEDDVKVANLLRRTKKPVVLAVNKVDSVKRDTLAIYEFYELGIGDPLPVSAGQALGLGDMLDQIIANFPEKDIHEEDDDAIKVAIIGKPNVGKSSLINKILGAVGLESLQRSWLGDSKTALWCIAFTLLWQAAGYYMVMHIAAMDGISPEIYESATLDGASAWRKLVSITMPLMKDIIGITFVLALSGTINLSFVLSQVMTGGGPNGASSVLLQYMYTQGFVNGNFGYAMAITVFTLAISVALSMLSRKLTDASEGGQ